MSDVVDLKRRATNYIDAFLGDLETIVNMDSGTFDKEQVDQVGEFLQSKLRDIGCEIATYPNQELGDNFVATLKGSGQRKLMLLGHFDTVYPLGTVTDRPFSVRDGRAYGPAVMDMKGGMIIACYALQILGDIGYDDFAEISFVANTDEEIGSSTSRTLIEDVAAGSDAVFVFEPGRAPGGVLATRKGVGMFGMEVAGRAAHAGAQPQDGRSANLELAHKIIAMHELNDFDIGTTVSANRMRGGERRNVIPDFAECEIDVRVRTQAEGDRVSTALEEIATTSTVPDTNGRLTGSMNRPPMEKVAGTDALLEVSRSILNQLGVEYRELTSGGGSDGNFTAAIGVPTLDALGPEGDYPHSVDEYIELASLPGRLALAPALLIDCPPKP